MLNKLKVIRGLAARRPLLMVAYAFGIASFTALGVAVNTFINVLETNVVYIPSNLPLIPEALLRFA